MTNILLTHSKNILVAKLIRVLTKKKIYPNRLSIKYYTFAVHSFKVHLHLSSSS